MNNKEKQIEEMAELICEEKRSNGTCSTDGCVCNYNCEEYRKATALYNAGYREVIPIPYAGEDPIREIIRKTFIKYNGNLWIGLVRCCPWFVVHNQIIQFWVI